MKRFLLVLILCQLILCLPLGAEQTLLLVSQKGASSVAFYTPEGKLLASVPVGTHPHELALSPDGRYAYTTDNGTMQIEHAGEGGNTVSVIDLHQRKRTAVISLGKYYRPHGIDINPVTGHLLVSTENPDQLLVVDLEKKEVIRRYDTQGQTPHIVAAGREGKWAYVSNARSGTVAAIELASGEVKLIPAGGRPEGSVLSKDGKRLYVVNRDSDELTIIDTEKKTNIGTIKTSDGPVRVGLSPDGRYAIYGLINAKAVGFADLEARKEIATVDVGGPLVSMHTSPDGKWAFTAAQDDDTVYVISIADRKLHTKFKTAAGAGPDPARQITVP
jgi:YVTN family beta-propeller protein